MNEKVSRRYIGIRMGKGRREGGGMITSPSQRKNLEELVS
jgi:hypothetical protein